MTRVKKRDALNLLEILEKEGFEARLVGGCVRDELMGTVPKDYDIASSATPEELIALFQKKQIRALIYGQEHGTITPIMPSGPVEITTLREDVETHGRRANVAFHKDFKTDACRRDFTINAMSQDRRGKVYDYFDGQKHLREHRLVFVGDPVIRIQEDYLRILRFFRFKSRFHLKSNTPTLKAIRSEIGGLAAVSHERITHEIQEIFLATNLAQTLSEMMKTGVLDFVFPPFEKLRPLAKTQSLDFLKKLKSAPAEHRALARIAMLQSLVAQSLKLNPLQSFELLETFKIRLSNHERRLIGALLDAIHLLPAVKTRRAEYLLFVDALDKRTEGLFLSLVVPFLKVFFSKSPLRLNRLRKIVQAEKSFGWRRETLPIDGKMIMDSLQISSGRLVGEVLEKLRYAYLEGEWKTIEEGLRWFRNET